ncbi:response regulator [Microcoleus sp. FACHB-1515]|uniref:hybrid sensor histidine kinase/response regulator n=1 Tax=Cyanophyceae TaxID=3028117 RepID=UPI001681D5C9|nr:ATP-binding protein [Microcoleus sp. FACHB-1515]MBD2092973.1 response regulator [Microcoleus sp. FACHB-1515]
MYQSIAALPANILVIDDTPENLELLSALLSTQGYKVRSVTKGSSGLRGAQAAPPDLILLDVNMPQMDGYEVCRRLKADQRTRHIPVIFISALEDVLDKVKAFEVGGVDYITKPFHVEEVLARIETHLTTQLLQRQLQAQNLRLQQEIRDHELAEEKFVKAFRASPSPIAITTLAEGRFVEVNPSFSRISGYSKAELIDRTTAELNLGIAPATYATAVQLLLKDGVLLNQECEFRTKSGEAKTVLLSLERIELSGLPCTLNIVNDITDRKRLENEFISLVSHELRTPLTSLVGALDLLIAGELGTLSEQGQHILKIATTNTERLMRLINDILDLEQMKSGKITIRKSRCDLADLLALAIEAMQVMADRSQIKLIAEPIDLAIWADSDRLLQTLTNLLSNAIKFSEAGSSIRISAQVKAGSPDAVLIAVQDQGRGIPADKLQIVFDRFQQVDASDSRQKGGTGLGLAICRSIVEQHNGKIWVESVLGQGSTFYVWLPIAS